MLSQPLMYVEPYWTWGYSRLHEMYSCVSAFQTLRKQRWCDCPYCCCSLCGLPLLWHSQTEHQTLNKSVRQWCLDIQIALLRHDHHRLIFWWIRILSRVVTHLKVTHLLRFFYRNEICIAVFRVQVELSLKQNCAIADLVNPCDWPLLSPYIDWLTLTHLDFIADVYSSLIISVNLFIR